MKNDDKFTKTEFLSGDMFSILVFQRKLRYLILKKRRHNKKFNFKWKFLYKPFLSFLESKKMPRMRLRQTF